MNVDEHISTQLPWAEFISTRYRDKHYFPYDSVHNASMSRLSVDLMKKFEDTSSKILRGTRKFQEKPSGKYFTKISLRKAWYRGQSWNWNEIG